MKKALAETRESFFLLALAEVYSFFHQETRLGVLRFDFVGVGDYNLVITKSLHSLLHIRGSK